MLTPGMHFGPSWADFSAPARNFLMKTGLNGSVSPGSHCGMSCYPAKGPAAWTAPSLPTGPPRTTFKDFSVATPPCSRSFSTAERPRSSLSDLSFLDLTRGLGPWRERPFRRPVRPTPLRTLIKRQRTGGFCSSCAQPGLDRPSCAVPEKHGPLDSSSWASPASGNLPGRGYRISRDFRTSNRASASSLKKPASSILFASSSSLSPASQPLPWTLNPPRGRRSGV